MPAGLSRAGRTDYGRCTQSRDVFRADLGSFRTFRPRVLSVRGVRCSLPGGAAPRRHDDVAESAHDALRPGRVTGMGRFLRILITLLLLVGGAAFYTWYSYNGQDASPDSLVGLGFAIAGTLFIILAAVLYSRRRRLHKNRVIGQLHASLRWHVCFA